MPLLPCRECGEKVSSKARVCPKCGIKKPTKKSKFAFIAVAFAFLILLGLLVGPPPQDQRQQTVAAPPKPEPAKLDYSKPIFTKDGAIICPIGLIYSPQASEAANLFFTVWGREEKAQKLGCQISQGGIRVFATSLSPQLDNFAQIKFSPADAGTLFTIENELTN